MDQESSVKQLAERARQASYIMQGASTQVKNDALMAITDELQARKDEIFAANQQDKKRAVEEKREASLQARLDLEGSKFESVLRGIEVLHSSPDPVGLVTLARELTHGLNLYRVSCPIGVICIVFEARPEAAVQISTLAIKSGNCVILKGGKEAAASNNILVEAMQAGLTKAGLPKEAVQLVNTREEVGTLLKLNGLIDLVVPRGSNQLVRSVMDSTSIPVLGHADGICAVYLDDEQPPLDLVIKVIVDSKCNYPAACNAVETLLIHEASLSSLQAIGAELAKNKVHLIADAKCYPYLEKNGNVSLADAAFGFNVEHLSLTLSIKSVASMEEAISFVNENGSHHTDLILTENEAHAGEFCRRVDSAGVYHNCSSRFADGFRYGFGAEVGVSTNRVHARGPVGMEGLLTYKYVCKGSGQIVGGMKPTDFTHKELDSSILHKRLEVFETGETKRARLSNGH